jgi:phosphoheptose isomerase
VFEEGRALFICGNGGSFAISTHFATDLHKIGVDYGVQSRIWALGTNNALSSAISNDYSFSSVFAKELSNLANPHDILFVISSSGSSANILESLRVAKSTGLTSIALTGFQDSNYETESDISIDLGLKSGDYELAEDVHSTICHTISISIRESMRKIGG